MIRRNGTRRLQESARVSYSFPAYRWDFPLAPFCLPRIREIGNGRSSCFDWRLNASRRKPNGIFKCFNGEARNENRRRVTEAGEWKSDMKYTLEKKGGKENRDEGQSIFHLFSFVLVWGFRDEKMNQLVFGTRPVVQHQLISSPAFTEICILSNCLPCFPLSSLVFPLFSMFNLSHFYIWFVYFLEHSLYISYRKSTCIIFTRFLDIHLAFHAPSSPHNHKTTHTRQRANSLMKRKREYSQQNVDSHLKDNNMSRQKQTIWRNHISSHDSQLHSAYSYKYTAAAS